MLAFVWALPREQALLRVGAGLYLLACVAFVLVPTPMGSNIERYGVLLAGPLLACTLVPARGRARSGRGGLAPKRGGSRLGRGGLTPLRGGPVLVPGRLAPTAIVALAAWALWAGWGPVRETLAVAGEAATSAAYYAPVERFLDSRGGAPVRVEVPLTRSHWEAAELAPRVSLARGWEKQLDTRFNSVLLDPRLTAAAYERWLRAQAVSYVALPDAKLDPSSAREGALIRAGLGYLHEVFSSRHWRIYAVRAPTPLLSGAARLTSLGHDSFALSAPAPAVVLVRVHYTRYWSVEHGSGCVGRGPGGWTRVVVRAAGVLRVRASFSLARAVGLGGACHVGGG